MTSDRTGTSGTIHSHSSGARACAVSLAMSGGKLALERDRPGDIFQFVCAMRRRPAGSALVGHVVVHIAVLVMLSLCCSSRLVDAAASEASNKVASDLRAEVHALFDTNSQSEHELLDEQALVLIVGEPQRSLPLVDGSTDDMVYLLFCPPDGADIDEYTIMPNSSALRVLDPSEDIHWGTSVAEKNPLTGVSCYNMSVEIVFSRAVGSVHVDFRLMHEMRLNVTVELRVSYDIYGIVLEDTRSGELVSGVNRELVVPSYIVADAADPIAAYIDLSIHAFFPALDATRILEEMGVVESRQGASPPSLSHLFEPAVANSRALCQDGQQQTLTEEDTVAAARLPQCPFTVLVSSRILRLHLTAYRAGRAVLQITWDREELLDEVFTTVLHVDVQGRPPLIVTSIEPSGVFSSQGGDLIAVHMFNCRGSVARSFWIRVLSPGVPDGSSSTQIDFDEVEDSYIEEYQDGSERVFFETRPGTGVLVAWNMSCAFVHKASILAWNVPDVKFHLEYAADLGYGSERRTLLQRDEDTMAYQVTEYQVSRGVSVTRKVPLALYAPLDEASDAGNEIQDEPDGAHEPDAESMGLRIHAIGCLAMSSLSRKRITWRSPCEWDVFILLVRSESGASPEHCIWTFRSNSAQDYDHDRANLPLTFENQASVELESSMLEDHLAYSIRVSCTGASLDGYLLSSSAGRDLEIPVTRSIDLLVLPFDLHAYVERPFVLTASLIFSDKLCVTRQSIEWEFSAARSGTAETKERATKLYARPRASLAVPQTFQNGSAAFFPANYFHVGRYTLSVMSELELCNGSRILTEQKRHTFSAERLDRVQSESPAPVHVRIKVFRRKSHGPDGKQPVVIAVAEHNASATHPVQVFFYLRSPLEQRQFCVGRCVGSAVELIDIPLAAAQWPRLRCEVVDARTHAVVGWCEQDFDSGAEKKEHIEMVEAALGSEASISSLCLHSSSVLSDDDDRPNPYGILLDHFRDDIFSGPLLDSVLAVLERCAYKRLGHASDIASGGSDPYASALAFVSAVRSLMDRYPVDDAGFKRVERRVVGFFPLLSRTIALEQQQQQHLQRLGSARARFTETELMHRIFYLLGPYLSALSTLSAPKCWHRVEYRFSEELSWSAFFRAFSAGKACAVVDGDERTVQEQQDVVLSTLSSRMRVHVRDDADADWTWDAAAVDGGVMVGILEARIDQDQHVELMCIVESEQRVAYELTIESSWQIRVREPSSLLGTVSDTHRGTLVISDTASGHVVATLTRGSAGANALSNGAFVGAAAGGVSEALRTSPQVIGLVSLYLVISVFFVFACVALIMVFHVDKGRRLFGLTQSRSSTEHAPTNLETPYEHADLAGRRAVLSDAYGRAAWWQQRQRQQLHVEQHMETQ
ncbi:hypothetical protein FVE85_6899 [Porphyridium purpureum]|uniref:Uncharacterized protein n=1 Tax=Porphyridium purpureum TaxID=35688 RepID=A0A5J4Z8K6_PORPP|nr:hypothetical protein FVE85_6899 [Porphyridium purpureum]|eukprot:POR7515..scf295_1